MPLWTPSPDRVASANMTRFMNFVHERHQAPVHDYRSLHRWSIEYPEQFWSALWDFGEIRAPTRASQVLEDGNRLPGAQWFIGARLNYAENLLRHDDDRCAIVYRNEHGERTTLSFRKLRLEVARIAAGLRRAGVKPGDRICGFLANTPQAVIAMLATTSIGAIWYSQSRTASHDSVREALEQLKPKLLFADEALLPSTWARRAALGKLSALARKAVPSEQVVTVGSGVASTESAPQDMLTFSAFGDPQAPLQFHHVRFDEPCFMTRCARKTDTPKYMVHCAGGVLLQQIKEQALHNDLRGDDRFLCLASCGEPPWYGLVSALATGASIVLYDGAPFHAAGQTLWRIAAEERVTVLGVPPTFLQGCMDSRLRPADTVELASLRTVLCVAAPLSTPCYRYVYEHIKADVMLAVQVPQPDIMASFAAGAPIEPVSEGEIQCVALGMRVEVHNDDARSIINQRGELVCTEPFPSLPIGFWGEADGPHFRKLYFEGASSGWHEYKIATLTPRGSMIIHEQTLYPSARKH